MEKEKNMVERKTDSSSSFPGPPSVEPYANFP